MAHIAFWFRHSSEALESIAELLCSPCLSDLTRTAMIDRNRWIGHKVKTRDAILEQLRAPKSQGVHLDSGRTSELNAVAAFNFVRDRESYPAPHSAQIIVEYDPSRLDDYLDTFCRFTTELHAQLAYVSLEPSFSEADSVALGHDNRETWARTDMSDRRRKERNAQLFYIKQFGHRLPAVHWGIYLSSGHREVVGLASLKESTAFHLVKELEGGLAYLQLTADPLDALDPSYERKLDQARAALAPLLIDLTDVELDPPSPE